MTLNYKVEFLVLFCLILFCLLYRANSALRVVIRRHRGKRLFCWILAISHHIINSYAINDHKNISILPPFPS